MTPESPPMNAKEKELADRLARKQVGGCTCMTKTPDLEYHDPLCTYRLCAEAEFALRQRTPEIPEEPSIGLINSMCFRFAHDFGLPKDAIGQGFTERERDSLRRQMRQVYEEISGRGFYRPEREQEYSNMLAAAKGGKP